MVSFGPFCSSISFQEEVYDSKKKEEMEYILKTDYN
jgi:hypothetical protein